MARRDSQLNREAILRVAAETLTDNPAATLTEIADRSGFSRATVYRHFASIEELHDAVLVEVQQVGKVVLQEGLPSAMSAVAGGQTVVEQIVRLFTAGVEAQSQHSLAYAAMPHPDDTLLETFGPMMRATVVEGQRSGEFAADLDPESTGVAIVAMMIHCGRRGTRLGLPIEETVRPLRTFLRGMESRGRGPRNG